MTSGVTFGLPSRSPPIQVPKVSGREFSGSSKPTRASSAVRSSRTSPTAAGVQLVQVVDGVAGLVGRFGADHAEFVGLPDEVDVLGEPGVVAAPVGLDDRGLQQLGDAAELAEDRAAGGLGGVGGEDRPHVEVLDGGPQVLGVGVLEPVGGAGQQPALLGAAGAQLAAPVDLLGDVGEVEVGGEGADQLGRDLQFEAAEEFGGGFPVRTRQRADALDEVEEFVPLLADQGLAQQITQPHGCRRGVRGWWCGRVQGSRWAQGGRWRWSWWPGRRHCSQVRLLAVCRARSGGGGPRCPTGQG